jgi:hypothetical protein
MFKIFSNKNQKIIDFALKTEQRSKAQTEIKGKLCQSTAPL